MSGTGVRGVATPSVAPIPGRRFGLAACAFTALGAVGCADLEHGDDVRVTVSGASEVEAGKTVTLQASTANGIVERYLWRSSDDGLATVDRAGRVTGRRAGEVTITAIGTETEQRGARRVTVIERVVPSRPDAGRVVDAGHDAGGVDAGAGGDAGIEDDAGGVGSDAGVDTGAPDAGGTSGPAFAVDVHPVLMTRCAACHAPGGSAAGTAYVLVDDMVVDRDTVLDLVNLANPESSRLLAKARGDLAHGGGTVLLVSSDDYAIVRDWIEAGAPP